MLSIIASYTFLTAYLSLSISFPHKARLYQSSNVKRWGSPKFDSFISTPNSILDMAKECAVAIKSAKLNNLKFVKIDFPLPVTGGTELDDWPGGIRQKYVTIRPIIQSIANELNFSKSSIDERRYLENEEDNAVGIWEDVGYQLICFPTIDSIDYINKRLSWSDNSTILVMINHQFFLDPLSKQQSIDFLDSAEIIYILEKLNMKGPGAFPITGLVYRKYPETFKIGRRFDSGKYIELGSYDTYNSIGSRKELERLFYEDSVVRDKDLSFLDRLKKQIPNFGS